MGLMIIIDDNVQLLSNIFQQWVSKHIRKAASIFILFLYVGEQIQNREVIYTSSLHPPAQSPK